MRTHHDSLLRAVRLHLSYGARPILDGVSVTVTAGQRLGLIGENGAGKSTLLRLLAGVETPDDGVVERPERTGLLWQEVQTAPDAVLGDIVERALVEHRAIERELEEAASALGSDAAADTRYALALAEAERADVWSLDARRDEVLAGLGVGDLPLDRPVAQVSGGQRSRVAMAALLLAQPDALLLDEPTNHLDDAAVAFLVSKLRQWRGVIVFASHDRAFLDDVATDLLDIDPSRDGVTRYGGGYSAYLVEKAAERRRWEQRVADEEQELARLEHAAEHVAPAINHARAISDNNKMAFGRRGDRVQQQISRRVQNAQARIADLEQSRAAAHPPVLRFAGIPTGSQVLDTDEPLVTVEGARVGDRLRVDEFALQPDARWLVTGPNGAGKSTLLGVLAGALAVDAGTVRRRKGLRVGMLSQDVRWPDADLSPRRLWERQVGLARSESAPLADLGLIAERDLDRPVGRLSIGQQRRMALALVIAKPPHVFLLDEPTNHLSLALATELEEALGGYPGAVVIASHDRWLRQRWSGPELALDAGRVREVAPA